MARGKATGSAAILPQNMVKQIPGLAPSSWEDGTTFQVLENIGIDVICQQIRGGRSIAQIATDLKLNIGSTWRWLNADLTRSIRAIAARRMTAWYWDEAAIVEIAAARTKLQLSKAAHTAHHYRWRAAKVDPKNYGDKITLGGDEDNPIRFQEIAATRQALIDRLQALARPEPLTIEMDDDKKGE